jgi:hypothetical protein
LFGGDSDEIVQHAAYNETWKFLEIIYLSGYSLSVSSIVGTLPVLSARTASPVTAWNGEPMAYGISLRYSILILILCGHGWYGVLLAGPKLRWRLLGLVMGFSLGPLGLFFFAVLTLRLGLFCPPRLARGWVLHQAEEAAIRTPRHIIYWGCTGYDPGQ